MPGRIPEADWKIFRQLHEVWLERYCTQTNEQTQRLLSKPGVSSYDRYLEVYKFIRDKDRELGFAFDDFRRSTATLQIRIIKNLGVITEEELGTFSEPTRAFALEKWE
ncbi:MAG: hypothetical protein QOH31_7026 [Verrucomicrobiota bacterium]|jgi:hypothetical protein